MQPTQKQIAKLMVKSRFSKSRAAKSIKLSRYKFDKFCLGQLEGPEQYTAYKLLVKTLK